MPIRQTLLSGAILSVALVFSLALTSSAATCPAPSDPAAIEFCSANFHLTSSGFSAIGGRMGADGAATIDYPRLPAAGTFRGNGRIPHIFLPLILWK